MVKRLIEDREVWKGRVVMISCSARAFQGDLVSELEWLSSAHFVRISVELRARNSYFVRYGAHGAIFQYMNIPNHESIQYQLQYGYQTGRVPGRGRARPRPATSQINMFNPFPVPLTVYGQWPLQARTNGPCAPRAPVQTAYR